MKLTEHQKSVVIPQAIENYKVEKDTNYAQIAKNAGVSAAYMTDIMKGNTFFQNTKIRDKYYLDLCKAIGFNITMQKWRHFNTSSFKLLFSEISRARKKRENLLIDYGTGLGKSYFAKKYKLIEPNETFVVTCKPAQSKKEFAQNIATVVGVKTTGTTDAITGYITEKLNSLDDAILIIDEFEYIEKKPAWIEVIKGLVDGMEYNVSLVIIGKGAAGLMKKYAMRGRHYAEQTASRLGKLVESGFDFSSDIEFICKELGIENKKIHNWLIKRVFNFRDLRRLLVEVLEESEEANREVDISLFDELYNGYGWV